MVQVKTGQAGQGQAHCMLGLGQIRGGAGRVDESWMLSKGPMAELGSMQDRLRISPRQGFIGVRPE